MKEGYQITTDEQIEKWKRILAFYDNLIDQGFKLRPIRFLVRHIINQEYSKVFYGGTSLYSLLISIPTNKRIDYTKTLQVRYDDSTQTVEFIYHDKLRSNRTIENSTWKTTCQATEVVDTFEFFLNENEDWNLQMQ